MALTSQPQKAGFPLTLQLKSNRLQKKSWVKISQIRVLSIQRFEKKIGHVTDEELNQAISGLNEIIT